MRITFTSDELNLMIMCVATERDRLEGRPLDRMGAASDIDRPGVVRLLDKLLAKKE